MNPVAAIGAVAGEPGATLLALIERLGQGLDVPGELGAAGASGLENEPAVDTLPQPPPGTDLTSQQGQPGLAARLAQSVSHAGAPGVAQSAAPAAAPAPTLDPAQAQALATAQAQQGRWTLGQMALQGQVAHGQPAALVAHAADSHSLFAQQALAAPALAPAAASGAATPLAVPVWLAPLQTPPSPHTPRHTALPDAPPRAPARRHRGEQSDEQNDPHGAEQQAPEEGQQDPSGTAPDAETDTCANAAQPPATPTGHALLERLRQHASAEAQRELLAGRRVLLVMPHAPASQGLVAAQVALLGPAGVILFEAARWWPGAALVAGPSAGKSAVWTQWRVFREGDPLRTSPPSLQLVSRADGHLCRVLLGTPAPHWLDNHSALLELPERLRFSQALGGQWSVLLVLAPA